MCTFTTSYMDLGSLFTFCCMVVYKLPNAGSKSCSLKVQWTKLFSIHVEPNFQITATHITLSINLLKVDCVASICHHLILMKCCSRGFSQTHHQVMLTQVHITHQFVWTSEQLIFIISSKFLRKNVKFLGILFTKFLL